MDQIFKDFGIRTDLLLAQILNFLILLFLLNKFLYIPILKMLDNRRQKIAQSLENAQEIEKKLAKTQEDREKELIKASNEARLIIEEGKINAQEIINNAHQKASADIKDMIEKSKTELSFEREKLHQEIRSQAADLVVSSLEKVTSKVLTDSDRKKLQSQTIDNLS